MFSGNYDEITSYVGEIQKIIPDIFGTQVAGVRRCPGHRPAANLPPHSLEQVRDASCAAIFGAWDDVSFEDHD